MLFLGAVSPTLKLRVPVAQMNRQPLLAATFQKIHRFLFLEEEGERVCDTHLPWNQHGAPE